MPLRSFCAITLAAACILADATSPGEATCAERSQKADQEEDLDVASLLQLGLSTATAEARRAATAHKASVHLPRAAERAANGTQAAHLTTAVARNASSEPALTAAALNATAPKAAALNATAPKAAALNATAPSAVARNATARAPLKETVAERKDLLEGIDSMPFLHLVNATYGLQVAQQEKLTPFKDPGGWLMFFIGLFLPVAAYAAYVLIGCCCARCLGKAIELGIETYDTSTLGVDVEIGKLLVNPCDGVIEVDGLTIDNPKGYKSDYLLQAKMVQVDFDLKSLILSGFTHVVVQKLVLRRVDIIYEKTWSSSNVHDVLAFLEGEPLPSQPQHQCLPTLEKKDEKREEEVARRKKAEKEKEEKNKKKDHLNIELREVWVEDVGLRLQGQMIGGHGARLALADIKYDNTHKEAGSGQVDVIVKFLLKSVMKTVVANVIGRRTAEWCM